ncbi:MAG: hypothetical protein ABI325_03385 [Ginsengibacter sp.]
MKTWTDGGLLRAITTGANNQGKALFSLMAYPRLGKIVKKIFYSIITYVRPLAPIASKVST